MISSFIHSRACRALGVALIALCITASGVVGADRSVAHASPAPRPAPPEEPRIDPSLLAHAERLAARDAFFSLRREDAAKLVRTPADTAVAVALEQVGKPYRTAAKGPDRFDCSGLTGFAWAAAGVDLPPSSRTQYAGLPHIALDELLPGDLLFRGSPIHHVSMYIGDNKMVHAPRTGELVRVEEVDFAKVVGAARPWEEPVTDARQAERVAPTTSHRPPR